MELLLTLLGALVLIVAAEFMLRGAVDIALRARISPLVVGLTVVSLGTSLPELLVSLIAALNGSPGIALGNVIGSNIMNISLVLGACIIIFPIGIERDARRIHWPVMAIASILFLVVLQDGRIGRPEGLAFVAALVLYVVLLIRASRKESIARKGAPPEAARALWVSILLLTVGVVGMAFGAQWFVNGATGMARTFGVSERLIGVTVVALGTSMPELIASLVAAFRKQPDISLGNLIGSNIFNILGIIGATTAIAPIQLDPAEFRTDLLVMFGLALLLYPLMRIGIRMGRWQGALLLVACAAYLIHVILRG